MIRSALYSPSCGSSEMSGEGGSVPSVELRAFVSPRGRGERQLVAYSIPPKRGKHKGAGNFRPVPFMFMLLVSNR